VTVRGDRAQEQIVRTFLLLVGMGALAAPTGAQPLEIFGYAGVLGEWELTAKVTEIASPRTREFFGPLTMTHVGLCTQDGPVEKNGEMRVSLSASRSELSATLSMAGVVCSYGGTLSGSYKGMMICPDTGPVPLTLWVK
jgi:hypothetical protein